MKRNPLYQTEIGGRRLVIVTSAGAPGAPSDLSASSSGATVTLTWKAPTTGGPPTSYVIEAGSTPGATDLASLSTGTLSTTFVRNDVPGGRYFVRVRATNVAGSSGPSNEVVVTAK